ncbi:MAG: flagellar biosynthetic protein FliR [Caulobacterales bacterium]
MTDGVSVGWVFESALLSLRVSPVFALAPPFSLTQVPALLRVLFGVGIATALVSTDPNAARISDFSPGFLIAGSVRELGLGLIFVLAFQLMFAAVYVAGRTLDIQAGFGLAAVIDPSTGSQMPLIGSLLAYGAAAVFFAMDGHADLLRILAASLNAIPLGGGRFPTSLAPLLAFISAVFITSMGVAGGAILCLFLADVAIALVSRTVPQMNVLILGLQIKSLLVLIVLPTTIGIAGALLVRLARLTLEAIPRLLL